MTISTIGTRYSATVLQCTHPEVKVYDSMYMLANEYNIIAQTAFILYTNHPAMKLLYMDTGVNVIVACLRLPLLQLWCLGNNLV